MPRELRIVIVADIELLSSPALNDRDPDCRWPDAADFAQVLRHVVSPECINLRKTDEREGGIPLTVCWVIVGGGEHQSLSLIKHWSGVSYGFRWFAMRLLDSGQAAGIIRADDPVTCSDKRYQDLEQVSCNFYEERFMYQKIVVALDGSESSRWALYEALEFAQLTQARLHAVYIVHPWCLSRYAGYFDPEQLRKVLREDGRVALDEARQVMAERGVPGNTEIEETQDAADDIPHCLARCVHHEGAGLVVMGTQGRHGIGRFLLGSVAEAFLRRADVPVLLVRSPQDQDEIPSGL
jgi:nucleotide-binding universal stress UspA family protein